MIEAGDVISDILMEAHWTANQQEQDESTRAYLVQLLEDDDVYESVECLQEMILPFVDDDAFIAESVSQQLMQLHKQQKALEKVQQQHQQQQEQKQKQDTTTSKETTLPPPLLLPSSFASEQPITTLTKPTIMTEMINVSQNNNDKNTNSIHHQQEDNEMTAATTTATTTTTTTQSHAAQRKQLRRQRRGKEDKKTTTTFPKRQEEHEEKQESVQQQDDIMREEAVEDDSSAWGQCQQEGRIWGGRGFGGRGEYAAAVNHVKSNIHLTNVTVALPNGTELLQNATMDIQRGHRYAIFGRNGCGKSTLLQRLAQRAIPGMPAGMRILLVQQQVHGSDNTPIQVLLQADVDRIEMLKEQHRLEQVLEAADGDAASPEDLANAAQQLADVLEALDIMGADQAEERAESILKGLQFTPAMLAGPTHNLSGGWRMRLALARALFVPHGDLLLLDECTNHLDLYGLDWLIQYLNADGKDDRTLIVVSHDRSFLNAVCTDVIHMEHQKLSYFPGNFADYERNQEEKAARNAQILDAADKQRAKAEAFVQKQQAMANKKSADPNKQRQAKMIKEKKMERIGNYREDGKRYKNFSLAKMSEDSIRLAQKVHIQADDPVIKMHFPNPAWPPGISQNDTIMRMEDLTFSFADNPNNGDATEGKPALLQNVTINLDRGSKIALVGPNGAGKSTIVRLIAGELGEATSSQCKRSGVFWRHPNIRIGYVSQYSVEELEAQHGDKTVVSYAEEILRSGRSSATILAKSGGNVRQYLGGFGLGGSRHALQPIRKLSGGERMRLCFATVLADEPHLLMLDESTNHVDIETLDSMSEALNAFQGSVLMVSHNQGFLSGFCNQLWVLENGHLVVNHSDTESFDELFSQYRSSVVNNTSMSERRRQKANMAKRATRQREGKRQNAVLL